MKLRRFVFVVIPMALLLTTGCRSDPTSTPPNEGGEGKSEPRDDTGSLRPAIDTTVIFQ